MENLSSGGIKEMLKENCYLKIKISHWKQRRLANHIKAANCIEISQILIFLKGVMSPLVSLCHFTSLLSDTWLGTKWFKKVTVNFSFTEKIQTKVKPKLNQSNNETFLEVLLEGYTCEIWLCMSWAQGYTFWLNQFPFSN